MKHDHDRSAFDEAAPIPTADIIPFPASLSGDTQAPDTADLSNDKKARPKHLMEFGDKANLLLAMGLDARLTPTAKQVLSLILVHRSKDTGESHPGQDTMARIIGCREKSVSDAVAKLFETKWIAKPERKRVYGGRGSDFGCNHYTILMDNVGPILAKAGVSFTPDKKPRCSKNDRADSIQAVLPPVQVDGEDSLQAVSRSDYGRFYRAVSPAKTPDNQPSEPTYENQPKEPVGSVAARPQTARNSSKKVVRESRFDDEPLVSVPTFDEIANMIQPVAEKKGMTIEEAQASIEKWREINADDRRTKAQWLKGAVAWIGIERLDTTGTRLPNDWWPDADLIAYASSIMRDATRREKETINFRLHYWSAIGDRALSRDWPSKYLLYLQKAMQSKGAGQRLAI